MTALRDRCSHAFSPVHCAPDTDLESCVIFFFAIDCICSVRSHVFSLIEPSGIEYIGFLPILDVVGEIHVVVHPRCKVNAAHGDQVDAAQSGIPDLSSAQPWKRQESVFLVDYKGEPVPRKIKKGTGEESSF